MRPDHLEQPPSRRRFATLTLGLASLAGCADTVSPPAPRDGTCLGIPWQSVETVEEVDRDVFVGRVRRRAPGRVVPAAPGCPALHDPVVLRWTPPRDGVAQVQHPDAIGVLVRAYDACDAAPRVCASSQGPTTTRGFSVRAGQPVFVMVARRTLTGRSGSGGVRDLDEERVQIRLGPRAEPYAPCELVAAPTTRVCDEGSQCLGGCIPDGEVESRCGDDAPCRPGLWCVNERCLHPDALPGATRCTPQGSPCPDGRRCADGRCRALASPGGSCAEDQVCVEGERCLMGRCASAPSTRAPTDCSRGQMCGPGERCLDGTCAREGVCDSATRPTSPVRCADDRWCVFPGGDAPLRCEAEGFAGLRCSPAGGCADGLTCLQGFCHAVARQGAPCTSSDAVCEPGSHCGPLRICTRDAAPGAVGGPCLSGRRCDGGAGCDLATLECVAMVASGAACVASGQCPAGEQCWLPGPRCVRPRGAGEACDEAARCESSLECRLGRCAPRDAPSGRLGDRCDRDGACRGFARCVAERCQLALPMGARCSADASCAVPARCRDEGGVRRCLVD